MEAEGKFWRHVGRGTFVGRPPVDNNTPLPSIARSTNPMEIMEPRLIVEPRLAGFAAIRATSAEIAQMYCCVEKSELATQTSTFELWDATLHRMIAEAAHNYLLLSVLNVVNAPVNLESYGIDHAPSSDLLLTLLQSTFVLHPLSVPLPLTGQRPLLGYLPLNEHSLLQLADYNIYSLQIDSGYHTPRNYGCSNCYSRYIPLNCILSL